MTIYIIDNEWVRIETSFNTWKFDIDELDEIQDVVNKWNRDDDDDVEIKSNGYREAWVRPECVYDYLYEWTLDDEYEG